MRLRTPAQRAANRRRAKTIMRYLIAAAMFLGLAGYLGKYRVAGRELLGMGRDICGRVDCTALAMTALGLISEAHHSSGIAFERGGSRRP